MALSAQGCSPHASVSPVGSGGAWGVRAVARTTGRGMAGWGGGGWVREGQRLWEPAPCVGWHLPALGPLKPGQGEGWVLTTVPKM